MNARRYDPDAAREDILDAAERLFSAKGFAGVSTAAIAEAAGVSQSQIHYHFETKKKLWDKVFERRFTDYFASQSSLLDDTAVDDLERMANSIVSYFDFSARNPDYVRLLSRAQLDAGDAPDGEAATDMGSELMRKGAERIRAAQEAGTIRSDIDPHFVIVGFLGLVASWFQAGPLFLSELGDEAGSLGNQAYLDFILQVYLRGISP